jgi:hypothetical protein
MYYRVLLSYGDFKHALRCAHLLLAEYESPSAEAHTVESALYSSMIVSYSRPFNSGGISNIGKIPRLGENYLRCLSGRQLEIHDYVLLCRNKLVGHSDAEHLDLDPFIPTDLPLTSPVPLKNDALAPFNASYTIEFRELCDKAVKWAVETPIAMEKVVAPHIRKAGWYEEFGLPK